uniref:Phospholipid phosphatase 1 n=1 Tax=Ornithorhynchus anatinus TaxID=9258 RepID=A0A6I8P1A3_ORNAN
WLGDGSGRGAAGRAEPRLAKRRRLSRRVLGAAGLPPLPPPPPLSSPPPPPPVRSPCHGVVFHPSLTARKAQRDARIPWFRLGPARGPQARRDASPSNSSRGPPFLLPSRPRRSSGPPSPASGPGPGEERIRWEAAEESHLQKTGLGRKKTFAVIILGEALSVYYNHLHSNSFVRNNYIATIYKAIGTFVFGAAASQSLTDIAKYSIGRLRPHFLAVCQPDWDKINCSQGYIENFPCLGNPVRVNEGRLSFYSGHSSFSMYCMLFLALYLQARMKGDWARLARPTIQFGLVASSIYVGLSRVSDYKHHWSDVLTGLVQGAVVAVLIVSMKAGGDSNTRSVAAEAGRRLALRFPLLLLF